MHALLPKATAFGVLVDPTSPDITDTFTRGVQSAAGPLGITLQILRASSDRELDSAFAGLVQSHLDGVIIGPSTYFSGRGDYLGNLATQHGVPAIFQYGSFTAAGGLLSYGTDETEYYRLVGGYVGKVLKGEKPADLPVQQSSKVELINNLKTAKKLGIDVPLSLLGRADEVIE